MTVQDILLVSSLPLSKPAVNYAAALAGLWQGHLTGLHVCTPLGVQLDPARPSAASMQLQWDHDRQQRARAAAEEFERLALAACRGHCAWHVVSGSLAESVVAFTDWHDLLIVQRDEGPIAYSMKTLAQLITTSAVPVLALPVIAAGVDSPGRIGVLWDGSAAATRAMHAALGWLRHADEVFLLVPEVAAGRYPPSGFDPAAYLLAHDVPHTLVSHREMPLDTRQILERLHHLNADLVVMGASGHSRFGEWRLDELASSALLYLHRPLLLAH